MSTRNIYWGVKAAGHPHVPIVLKSESLNLLEPSGPVQVCNGIALTLGSDAEGLWAGSVLLYWHLHPFFARKLLYLSQQPFQVFHIKVQTTTE